jgi:hypothetical protein
VERFAPTATCFLTLQNVHVEAEYTSTLFVNLAELGANPKCLEDFEAYNHVVMPPSTLNLLCLLAVMA